MALEIIERHAVVQGIPLVQGSDKYFWFGRPQLVLHLIHFALFQVLNILFLHYSAVTFYGGAGLRNRNYTCVLIHFILQNAFQLTYFLWIWVSDILPNLLTESTNLLYTLLIKVSFLSYVQYEYGIRSCFHDNFGLVIAKIALGWVNTTSFKILYYHH